VPPDHHISSRVHRSGRFAAGGRTDTHSAAQGRSGHLAREMLSRAGLTGGQRILDVGAHLHGQQDGSRELEDFRVVGVEEHGRSLGAGELRAVDTSASVRLTVEDVDDLELPDAGFDAVLAVDRWPVHPVDVVLKRWRRLLDPRGGVVIVTGTDVHEEESVALPTASSQWINGFETTGFDTELVLDLPLSEHRYRDLAVSATKAAPLLRKTVGAGPTSSYLVHVEQLVGKLLRGRMNRFAIVARRTDAS
jgi:SAM-dependent methyltransferase